jgi:hypothetical protein
MNDMESRDLTAKDESPKLPDVDETIQALAEEMVSAGYIMVPGTAYWVAILTINMHNHEGDERSVSGAVFGGVYSTSERAMAATRGIAEDIYEANKKDYEHVQIDNSIIETYVDVVPKSGMHHEPQTITEINSFDEDKDKD